MIRAMGEFLKQFERLPPYLKVALGCFAVLLIGMTDTLTGPYMWWTFVYVVPVTFFSWLVSRPSAVLLALLSGLVSLFANLSWEVPDRPEWIGFWNGIVTGATCLFLALTVTALKKSVQAREVMTNVISHDLNNVLTALGLNLEHLNQSTSPDDKRRPFIDAANAAALRMQRMVHDFSLLTNHESERLELQAAQTDLSGVLADSLNFYRPLAAGKKIALRASGIESPAIIQADRDRIAEVLDNLLGNAVKFTPAGGTIDLALHRNGTGLEITLQDSGPGIRPEQRGRVFEPYWKGTSSAPGSGLGLFISRKIVESHGGRIWFDGPAPGTVTHVSLPISAR
jgi:signal transduction histidine kinase